MAAGALVQGPTLEVPQVALDVTKPKPFIPLVPANGAMVHPVIEENKPVKHKTAPPAICDAIDIPTHGPIPPTFSL